MNPLDYQSRQHDAINWQRLAASAVMGGGATGVVTASLWALVTQYTSIFAAGFIIGSLAVYAAGSIWLFLERKGLS